MRGNWVRAERAADDPGVERHVRLDYLDLLLVQRAGLRAPQLPLVGRPWASPRDLPTRAAPGSRVD